MVDTYEKDLAQKSSLTTSDFIRVVGSDNVSYKQGVSTVASVINSAQPIETHSGSIKQWALQRNGQAIICTSPTRTTDLPDISNKYGVAWTKSYVGDTNIGDTNKWVNLYWSPTNTSDIYICSNMSNIDSWTAWQKMPTRAEIDALNSKWQNVNISSQGSIAISLANNTRAMLFFSSAFENATGILSVYCTSGGEAGYINVTEMAAVTITGSGRALTIRSTSNTNICILNIGGQVTVS